MWQLILKTCALFTDCVSKTNNTQLDNAKDLDIVMSMYNVTEYGNNYSKPSGSLWQYYRDEPALDANENIVNFPGNSASFKSKVKITGKTLAGGNTKEIKIAVPLRYLSHFWRTLEMPLISREINLILTCSSTSVVTNSTSAETFAITDTKLYVPAITLSTKDNAKLLEQLKSGFKRTIYCNKYQSKVSLERQNQCLDYLVDPSFKGANRFFVVSFEDNAVKTGHMRYFLLTV